MPGVAQLHRSDSSVAILHDEDIRCSVCPRPPLVRSGFRSFAQREQLHAVRLKLPSFPFNLNYMLCVIAIRDEWDLSTIDFGIMGIQDVIE